MCLKKIREKGHHKISYDVKKYGTSCEECITTMVFSLMSFPIHSLNI